MTLLRKRQLMMKEIVDAMIDEYISQHLDGEVKVKRHCATCGKVFPPKNRNHFFHTSECRKIFYRGQFVTCKG